MSQLLGIHVLVPMTPALFGPYALARFAIGGWMAIFALLGWALATTDREAPSSLDPSVALETERA